MNHLDTIAPLPTIATEIVTEIAAEVATLLSQRVGFDANIIGVRKIQRVLEIRQTANRSSDMATYLHVLKSSKQEFDAFVEQLVVPETWFFRDRKPFDYLGELVRSQRMSKSSATKLRLLSVPCSTGEEPYSIAIALLEAGLSTEQFSIDAMDISRQALAKAQRALYGKNSFRGEDWVDRNRYFTVVNNQYTPRLEVRSAVRFHQGNLLDELTNSVGKYDIIFCRNVLIYLDNTACQQILHTLHSRLVPNGLLFVGAAETGKVPSDRFSYIRQAFTFAYRKIDFTSNLASQENLAKMNSRSVFQRSTPQSSTSVFQNSEFQHHTPQHFTLRATATADRETQAIAAQSKPISKTTVAPAIDATRNTDASGKATLQQAQQLANSGRIVAAIDCCKTYLKSDSTNAEAHALLGTLYQATADEEQAEQCFQKALYLQPNLYEALMQLALLKEFRGDVIASERLRQRIQKLQITS